MSDELLNRLMSLEAEVKELKKRLDKEEELHLNERHQTARAKAFNALMEVQTGFRDSVAVKVIAAMIAGDWKFPADTPEEWDKIAVRRAYLIADAFLKESEITDICQNLQN